MVNLIDKIWTSRFWALFKKEIAQIFSNRQLIIQLLVPPTVFLIIFGFALNPEFENLKVGITDYSHTPASREFIELFAQTDAFTLDKYYTDSKQMKADLVQGRLIVGITIPPEFDKDLARKRSAQVQAVFDAIDANTASIAASYINQLVSDYNFNQLINFSRQQNNNFNTTSSRVSNQENSLSNSATNNSFNSSPLTDNDTLNSPDINPSSLIPETSPSPSSSSSPQTPTTNNNDPNSQIINSQTANPNLPPAQVRLNTSVLYNPGLESAWFIVPGIMGVVLTVIGSQAAASLVVREKEAGTIEQLMMTPASDLEIILAKVSPLLVLLVFDTLMALGVGKLIFNLPFRGNLFLFLIIAILYFFVGISIGILIASYARNEQQAQLITFFINPPLVLLSGAMTPISSMPTIVQWLTYIDPMRYFIEVCRGIFLKGIGLESLWLQVTILLIFALVFLRLSILQFRRQLS